MPFSETPAKLSENIHKEQKNRLQNGRFHTIFMNMLEDAEDGDRFPFRFPATLFSFLQHHGKLIDRTDREP